MIEANWSPTKRYSFVMLTLIGTLFINHINTSFLLYWIIESAAVYFVEKFLCPCFKILFERNELLAELSPSSLSLSYTCPCRQINLFDCQL